MIVNPASPHENEFLAAVSGLHEQTHSPRTYAVGDFVSGITCGKRWQGRIEWINGNELCVNTDGSWVYVPVADVTH